jgi:hypothetical protein
MAKSILKDKKVRIIVVSALILSFIGAGIAVAVVEIISAGKVRGIEVANFGAADFEIEINWRERALAALYFVEVNFDLFPDNTQTYQTDQTTMAVPRVRGGFDFRIICMTRQGRISTTAWQRVEIPALTLPTPTKFVRNAVGNPEDVVLTWDAVNHGLGVLHSLPVRYEMMEIIDGVADEPYSVAGGLPHTLSAPPFEHSLTIRLRAANYSEWATQIVYGRLYQIFLPSEWAELTIVIAAD